MTWPVDPRACAAEGDALAECSLQGFQDMNTENQAPTSALWQTQHQIGTPKACLVIESSTILGTGDSSQTMVMHQAAAAWR